MRVQVAIAAAFLGSAVAAHSPLTSEDEELVAAMEAQGIGQICVLLPAGHGDPKTVRLMSSTGSAPLDERLLVSLRSQNRRIFGTDGGSIERYPGDVWEQRKSFFVHIPQGVRALGCTPEEMAADQIRVH